ncbi:MAG: sporulation protein YqfD [Bacteroidales bacterium]|nr:sporulation protein YqfD [Bacteroidales bacterium]MCM1416238.1 sporulation protein YqfD [bacterium]MCM1424861.1 sporulation protein YqfD [bacterium]
MLHWVQYIRGYVLIKVWGYSVERLLNLCGNHDILVWGIEDHGDYHTMRISIEGFFALKPLLKKTGTRAAVLHRYGLPFFVSKLFARKIFVAGLFLCLFFWGISSRFIWDIRIEGNLSLTEDVLLDYLEERGIHTAMKKSALQIEPLEQALREDYDLITWTSAQLKGTTLLIRIKENDTPDYETETQKEDTRGIDLIAARDGVVTYIITRKGVPLAAQGQSVQAGDVLVSGAIPVYNEDTTVRRYQFVEADADITLRYAQNITLEEAVAYEEKLYTGEAIEIPVFGAGERAFSLRFLKIPYEHYDISEEKQQIRILDHLYLPFYYGKRTIQAYDVAIKKHTEEEMKALLSERWSKIIETLDEKGVQIAKKNVTIKRNDEKWVLNAGLLLEESAVKKRPSRTEQPPQEDEIRTEE